MGSRETNCWLCLPPSVSPPSCGQGKGKRAAMGTHIWKNPASAAHQLLCVGMCTCLCDGLCGCASGSLCCSSLAILLCIHSLCAPHSLPCPLWLPLTAYTSHSQHPFVPLMQYACTGLISPLLPLCALTPSFQPCLMSLSASLSPINSIL